MCRLFESIRVENREFVHLQTHLDRMDRSRKKLWKSQPCIDPGCIAIPAFLDEKIWKCRVEYDLEIRDISFFPYIKKNIQKVKLVQADHIQYDLKYTDRLKFQQLFIQHPGFDEFILIRDKHVTDSSFSNLAFHDGSGWYTPTTYLLPGTRRALLLQQRRIREIPIQMKDLDRFQLVSFINAMLDLGELVVDCKEIQ